MKSKKNKNQKEYLILIKVTINQENIDEASNIIFKKNVIKMQGETEKSTNTFGFQCTSLAKKSKYLNRTWKI